MLTDKRINVKLHEMETVFKKQISINIKHRQYDWLKQQAEYLGCNINEYMRDLIENSITTHELQDVPPFIIKGQEPPKPPNRSKYMFNGNGIEEIDWRKLKKKISK